MRTVILLLTFWVGTELWGQTPPGDPTPVPAVVAGQEMPPGSPPVVTGPRPTGVFVGTDAEPEELLEIIIQNTAEGPLTPEIQLNPPEFFVSPTLKTSPIPAKSQRTLYARLKSSTLKETSLPVSVAVSPYGPQTVTLVPSNLDFRIFLPSHFHFDPVWKSRDGQRGYAQEAFRIVSSFLEAARLDPDYHFVLDQVPYLKPYWDFYPEDRAALKGLLESGRLEIVGGTYNLPDNSAPGGEALLRNFIAGCLFEREVMGAEVVTGWGWDIFGFTRQWPQMAQLCGLKYFLSTRGGPLSDPRDHEWMAPDGSSLLTCAYSPRDPRRPELALQVDMEKDPASMTDAFRVITGYMDVLRRKSSTRNALLMVGDDFSPAQPGLPLWARVINNALLAPQCVMGTPRDYFEAVTQDLQDGQMPARLISKDMNPLYMGCYTSRIDLKLANRSLESQLTLAETLATVAWLEGSEYPWEDLDAAWRQVLYGQHHDAITGTSNEISYLDLVAGYREGCHLASQVTDTSLKVLAGLMNVPPPASLPEATPLFVFNVCGWPRSDVVHATLPASAPVKIWDELGTEIPSDIVPGDQGPEVVFVADNVPSVGYRVFFMASAPDAVSPPSVEVQSTVTIQNEFYAITVDPARGGGIASLVHVPTGKTLLDSSGSLLGNELMSTDEVVGPEAPWNLYRKESHTFSSSFKCQVFATQGRCFSSVKVVGPFSSSRRIQEITLWHGVDRVECDTYLLDYTGTDDLIQVAFPTFAREIPVLHGVAYGSAWRSPDLEYPAVGWADVTTAPGLETSDGIRVPIYDVGLVVPPGRPDLERLARPLVRALAEQNVGTTLLYGRLPEDPALRPEEGTRDYALGDLPSEGVHFVVVLGDPSECPGYAAAFAGLEGARARLQTDTLLYVPAGTPGYDRPTLHIHHPDLSVMGSRIHEIAMALEGNASLGMTPFAPSQESSSTGRVDSGLCLLLNGNVGTTLTRDGLLTLSLMRSSTGGPSGADYVQSFETEQWNHVFHYALVGHSGVVEEELMWKRSSENVLPLLATAISPASPGRRLNNPRGSWLGCSGGIVTSIAPAGFPVAGYDPSERNPLGVAVRFFNPSGRPGVAELMPAFTVIQAQEVTPLLSRIRDLEVVSGKVSLESRPFGIHTVCLVTSRPSGISMPPAIPNLPDYGRFWLHNDHVEAPGNQHTNISFSPETLDPASELNVSVRVATDRVSTGFQGKVKLELPPGWSAVPETWEVSLKPEGWQSFHVKIQSDGRDGFVRAILEGEGVHLYDSLVVGTPGSLVIKSLPLPNVLTPGQSATGTLEVSNPLSCDVVADVRFIAPIECWGREAGAFGLVEVTPSRQRVRVGPSEQATVSFTIQIPSSACPGGSYWVVARVAHDGRVSYSRPYSFKVEG